MENTKINEYIKKNLKVPLYNVGIYGSVSDGKTTLIESLSNTNTRRHANELKGGFTINIGFTNIKIYIDESKNYIIENKKNKKNIEKNKLLTHFSFIDCPGHYNLILKTLCCSEILDAAIIVISLNEELSTKPQLKQHLQILKKSNVKKIIVCLNKLDLVYNKGHNIEYVKKKMVEIKELFNKIGLEPSVYIPTCLSMKIGIDTVTEAIINNFHEYCLEKNYEKQKDISILKIVSTFDINSPGISFEKTQGGIIGGTLKSGFFSPNDKIKIYPGFISSDKKKYTPITGTIESIQSNRNNVNIAIPGGLFGLKLDIDPALTSKDLLKGQILVKKDTLLEVYNEIVLEFEIKQNKIFKKWTPKKKTNLLLIINLKDLGATIIKIIKNKNIYKCTFILNKPVSIYKEDNIHIILNDNNQIIPVAIAKFISGKTINLF